MAGKKKKSLANKLAKMSDEERARYLQNRADIEEEAKRRKEQLIATFLKKKIKKEEAFSRLNLAKINQNWHQILRKAKCQEMRKNVDHMREWIERLVAYKNNTIQKLLKQLEETEEEYSINFRSHSTHIDDILEHQNQYVDQLKKQYEKDREALIICAEREKKVMENNADANEKYLKTILFGQDSQAKGILRKEYEGYMLKCYEAEYNFQSKLNNLRKSREGISGAIWKQIAETVEQYVTQTDLRRSHLAELKRLDSESAVEIFKNEERIKKEEIAIDNSKKEYAIVQHAQEGKINYLELQLKILNKHFLNIRRNLQLDLQTDEKQMKLLTDISAKSLKYLENLNQKGQHITNLAETCKKFETDREKLVKWIPKTREFLNSGEESPPEMESDDMKKTMPEISVDGSKVFEDHSSNIPDYAKSKSRSAPSEDRQRPKTSIAERILSPQKTIPNTPTPEPNNVTTIQNIVLQAKPHSKSSSPSSSDSSVSLEDKSKSILERCFESLKDLEGFWISYNKVEVDFLEIKDEKKLLEKENKQLRGMIRAVLEAAALSKSFPNSKVSTRLPSRRRSIYSAPLRRIIF
ncbi:dynein regulatory complex subunit 2 [Leptinotarsa decemlineata]|uniref:dynein regulatory complex subunit 2 n=1 Tax=Leptinotarsa decemlineata TaxID=7539 RepID=UPI003D305B77